MQAAGARLLPFRDGEPLDYAAIWCSQQTQDFLQSDNPEGAFDQMHGANELCLQAHVPSAVVFDDDVASGGLARYPVLLAANAACVSRGQAEALRGYVADGGVLVACAGAGAFDEWGQPHARPVLDDLLGIVSRRPSHGNATLEFPSGGASGQATGGWLSYSRPFVIVEPMPDVEMLAQVADRTSGSWDGIETGGAPFPRYGGAWRRRVGKGWVVYLCVDLFGSHLAEPTVRAVRFFRQLVTALAPPSVAAEAPLCVTLNARRLSDGRIAVVLHNAPGTVYRYPAPARANYLHAPGEIAPLLNLTVCLHGRRCARAVDGFSGAPLKTNAAGTRIRVPRLDICAVVVLEGVAEDTAGRRRVQEGRPARRRSSHRTGRAVAASAGTAPVSP